MKNASPEVDAYIERAALFAKPILMSLRRLIHKACPDVQETIKWGMPHFEYHGLLAHMAAFKQHASFSFWKSKLMSDPQGLFQEPDKHWVRLTSVEDLPSDKILLAYIREAMRLNEDGVKAEKPPQEKRSSAERKKELVIPDDLQAGLRKNKAARETFEGFSYTNQRDYLDWITEAKQPATRQRRLATTLEWLAEGKARNWKYMNCKTPAKPASSKKRSQAK